MTARATRRDARTPIVEPRVLELPSLVKGELLWPPPIPADQLELLAPGPDPVRLGEAYVVPVPGPDGNRSFVIVPYAEPAELIETDQSHLADCLHELPFDDVLGFCAQLSELLRVDGELVQSVLAADVGPAAESEPETLQLAMLEMLPGLFDPDQIQSAVAAELDQPGSRGRDLLDGWITVGADQQEGVNVRLADAVFAEPGRSGPVYTRQSALIRAIPTRQLHVTAGSGPLIPALSLVRALSTKGAAVIKCPTRTWLLSTILVLALNRLAEAHPLARHTSLVYWQGGDRAVEDVLLADSAFDRVVAWGGAESISSIRRRTTIRTILFEPRIGVSLIGREAFGTDLRETIVRATADSLIENQAACTASLVHYVETDEAGALRYCRGLQAALARWDAGLPHRPSAEAQALLRRLRRETLIGARWFVNGSWPEVTSAVVYAPYPVDLAGHPMSRCVIVRRVDDLGHVLPHLDHRMAAAGIWPPAAWLELRSVVAARGVTTVAPLGESERRWAGMPHDGMRPLAQLVNWSVA